jgi:chromosome segregation ATPase
MSQQDTMSFAQALNEAKGVIIQLSNRVKADADKVRTQQQTIVSQCATIAEHEEKMRAMDAAAAAKATEMAALTARIAELESARDSADAMINRQGERIRTLEAAKAENEARMMEMAMELAKVTTERDDLRGGMPTQDDQAALAGMAALLAKAAPVLEKAKKTGPTMRIAQDDPIAEAA